MLINIDNVLPLMIQTMLNLKYEFFLTGTRFFNSQQDTSKVWEFFVQDSIETTGWLLENDFKLQDQLALPGGSHSYRYSNLEFGTVIYVTTVKSQRTMNRLHQTVKKLNPDVFKSNAELQSALKYAFQLYLDFNPNGQTE